MRILVSGGTGFLGRALLLRLLRGGHDVTVWARNPVRASKELGSEVRVLATGAEPSEGRSPGTSPFDGVIDLAGEPVLGGRWTARRRKSIMESRLRSTERCLEYISRYPGQVHTLINASATGFYGDRGTEVLDESSARGKGFLADVCDQWEQAAWSRAVPGLRVVIARIGVVLGLEGGALASQLPPFKAGLGGPIASGDQMLSWIHLEDVIEALVFLLEHPELSGPFNLVAPSPVSNRQFTAALGAALHRPAGVPIPSLALQVLFGDAAEVLTTGQHVSPKRLMEAGFSFRFPEVKGAIADLVQTRTCSFDAVGSHNAPADTHPYLQERRPVTVLTQSTRLPKAVPDIFSFFSEAGNLAALTPPALQFEITHPDPIAVQEGTSIDYRVKIFGIPMRWRTVIERWEPGVMFVDAQHIGPYRCWWHEHRFRAEDGHTVMEDRVYYAVPLGPLGRVVDLLFIRATLRRIFEFRRVAITLRFGS